MLAYELKLKKVSSVSGTTIAGNDLINRYTMQMRETISSRKSSRKKTRVMQSEFDLVHTQSEVQMETKKGNNEFATMGFGYNDENY